MPDPGEMSQSIEDYVEAIAFLQQDGKPARIRDIASSLGVSRPSVTGAVAQLVKKELVNHEHYGGVELTPRGQGLAQKLLRRHETLARFLREVLELPADLAETDACRLEHAMSKQTYQRFEQFFAKLTAEKKQKP